MRNEDEPPKVSAKQHNDDEEEEEIDPDALRFFNRSPHPYHRRSASLRGAERPTDLSLQTPDEDATSEAQGDVKSTVSGNTEWKSQSRIAQSSSDSGSEADDESYNVVKALPAPPIKPRKGLRDTKPEVDGSASPLLSPAQVDEDGLKLDGDYFLLKREGSKPASPPNEEAIAARQRYIKRRRAEVIRRTTEVLLCGAIGVAVIAGCHDRGILKSWHRVELFSYILVVPILAIIYFTRLAFFRKSSHGLLLGKRIKIPAAFDPATLLYPVLLPVMVSISISPAAERTLLPNMVLGLSAIPPRLIQFGASNYSYNTFHWFISLIPVILSENTDWPSKTNVTKPYLLKSGPPEGLRPDILALLYALHQALLPPLNYLTTTSLLPAELQLLSVSLINVLLFASSSQITILSILLWAGGLGVFLTCGKVLTWGVQLARIPRWRFRRAGAIIKARQSFLQALNESISSNRKDTDRQELSESDDEAPLLSRTFRVPRRGSLRLDALRSLIPERVNPYGEVPKSADEGAEGDVAVVDGNVSSRKRSNTLPGEHAPTIPPRQPSISQRSRKRPSAAKSLMGLTHAQATVRKWIYAGWVYFAILGLIFGPCRYLVGIWATQNYEPFCWAIGYALGDIPAIRDAIHVLSLDSLIPYPSITDPTFLPLTLGRADTLRLTVLGAANTRLLICAYCVFVLFGGMVAVLGLPDAVEVDTRRKVFHGMMVAMLLPTIFVDPAFVSLALILILAAFLLLDLIRASQLPPLSKPLATFLQPYVDGRDLRGPVVVSHIFLLIGCAIPLWLSLGALDRAGPGPWDGWEVIGRDVSMLAGVICVGMGDAAASLIGRRFGRRKWPWAGGKSLEGSAAFAVAVTIGLMAGKFWLALGEWDEEWSLDGREVMRGLNAWVGTAAKAGVAACGASLMEAVLTGGNDNVIVPVVLWLLVRGLRV